MLLIKEWFISKLLFEYVATEKHERNIKDDIKKEINSRYGKKSKARYLGNKDSKVNVYWHRQNN